MNPGPQLHRSIIFWAGLVIILFTCWAWRDSREYSSSVYGNSGSLESALQGLHIDWWSNPHHSYLDWHFHRSHMSPDDFSARWQRDFFPPPFLVRHQSTPDPESHTLDPNVMADAMQLHLNGGNPGSGMAFIPYWLIVLALLITWTALLFLRARRRRRTITPPLGEGTS